MLKNVRKMKFNQDAYKIPYVIATGRNNVTVRGCKGRVMDTVNIRNLTPYERRKIVYCFSRIVFSIKTHLRKIGMFKTKPLN